MAPGIVGVLVGVSLGCSVKVGVREGMNASIAVPAGAQALKRRINTERKNLFIVRLGDKIRYGCSPGFSQTSNSLSKV
jgi:hypothetical protein